MLTDEDRHLAESTMSRAIALDLDTAALGSMADACLEAKKAYREAEEACIRAGVAHRRLYVAVRKLLDEPSRDG